LLHVCPQDASRALVSHLGGGRKLLKRAGRKWRCLTFSQCPGHGSKVALEQKSKSPLAPQLAALIAMRRSWEGDNDNTSSILLGMMVAWTPSLVLLGWFLLLEDRQKGVTEKPA
jgi:hypothetical protein